MTKMIQSNNSTCSMVYYDKNKRGIIIFLLFSTLFINTIIISSAFMNNIKIYPHHNIITQYQPHHHHRRQQHHRRRIVPSSIFFNEGTKIKLIDSARYAVTATTDTATSSEGNRNNKNGKSDNNNNNVQKNHDVTSSSSSSSSLPRIRQDDHKNINDSNINNNNNNNTKKKMTKRRFQAKVTAKSNNSNHSNNKGKQSKKQIVRTMFRQAKEMERTGQWKQACIHLNKILEYDPYDSHSYLALGRLQSRREQGNSSSSISNSHSNNHSPSSASTLRSSGKVKLVSVDNHDDESLFTTRKDTKSLSSKLKNVNSDEETEITPLLIVNSGPRSDARNVFYKGTEHCPDSIHLWQAWALHEQSQCNVDFARYLFQKALFLDESNSYVCHGYGLLEHKCGNFDAAMELWERPLKSSEKGKTTAALVCSIGKLLVAKGELNKARDLYMRYVLKIKSEREICEVYLAAAWLEEKHFLNIERAEELLNIALTVSPGNSRASIALARLAGRKVDLEEASNGNALSAKEDIVRRRQLATKNELKETCEKLIGEYKTLRKRKEGQSEVLDGRLFNAWANMEVQDKNYTAARRILSEGRTLFPHDHSLIQSAGKLEERAGNFTGARDLYGESLMLSPSAPTLVAYALLDLKHPIDEPTNYTKVEKLFQEAILLDPRHGPTYNAYGNMELKRGNVEKARQIYQNGVFAQCRDVSSVYHGLAMLELSLGNVETARLVLIKGLKEVKINDGMMDNSRRKRSQFLTHTLGMLELNSNRALEAKLVFEAGLDRHGNSSQLLLGAALSDVNLGNEESARNLFERSVHVDRRHAQAWQSWGVMEMRAGNYKVAKTLFQCGIKNDPKHGALWQAYATMESRLGNFETARALFAAGVSRCPDHVPLYQAWACLEIRGENYEQAKTLISEALTRDKTEGSGWLVAAKIEEKLGNEGLMIMILRRGLECAPNSAELYCAVADYEVKQGKINLARDLLERGLDIDPLHAPLYHSLAELEARVFNIQGLAELNKRAAKIFHNNALEPPPISMNLLGSKLRKSAQSKKKVPNNINALVQQLDTYNVGEQLDVEEAINDMDPDTIIESISQNEEDNVADIFLKDLEVEENSKEEELYSK